MIAASAMAMFIVLAIVAVRKRDFKNHRAWIIRAYALGQGAGTQVVLLLPFILTVGELTHTPRDIVMSFAWIINILVAEKIIHSPGNTFTTASKA